MTDPSKLKIDSSKATLILRFYFALVTFLGALTLWSLLRIPAEAQSAVLLGLSKERLILVAGIVGILLAAFGMLLASWLRKAWFTAFQQSLIQKIEGRKTWGLVVLLCSVGLLGGSYYLLLTPEVTEPFTRAYLERLGPLILWFTLLCGLTLITLPLLRYGFNPKAFKPKARLAYSIAIIFGGLLVFWLLIALTGIGVNSADGGRGWNALGSPVMETQVFLAWCVALIYIGLALWGEDHPEFLERVHRVKLVRADLVISFLIWLVAFLVWNSLPLIPNWFATYSGAPNQAIYPHSDSISYDTTGQSLLIGLGLKTHNTPFALRPMYTLFLATIHAIGGLDYEPIIWMQVAVLALIPVLLYWITRQVHNRVSALIAVTLLIARESNAIILGSSITTSHVKLLMADLPTALGVMLFILLLIRWLQNPAQRQTLTLVAGGVTGTFMLIRPEFGVLLPFVGLAALLQLIRTPKIWFRGMLLLTVGLVLMLAPWIWRNYQITGTIFLDSPYYRTDLFAHRYQESGESQPPATQSVPETTPETPQPTPTRKAIPQEGESEEEFAERMAEEVAQFAISNPQIVLHFIINHFANSQIQTVLYLPDTFRLGDSALGFLGHKDPVKLWEGCCSAQNYIRRLPFWFKWNGQLPRQAVIPLLINLFLIAVGLASAWKQQRFIGLLPLAASIGYTLINAVVRNSGGRYILPIDWVGIFYFSMGLGQLTIWLVAYFRGAEISTRALGEIHPRHQGESPSLWQAANFWVTLAIFLFGCILPLSEKIIQPRYTDDLLTNRQNALLQSAIFADIDPADWNNFFQTGGAIIQGRALYPSFFQKEDEAAIANPLNLPPLTHVAFYLIGPFNSSIVIPRETPPPDFPNGADVLLIGCVQEKYIDALVVSIYDDAGNQIAILQRQPFAELLTCPLPSP